MIAPQIRIIPLTAWPQADQQSWADAVHCADVLEKPGPLAHLSEDQRARKQSAYGRWLGFLAETIWTSSGITGVDAMTQTSVTAFIGKLKELFAPYTVAGYVTDLDVVLRAFQPNDNLGFLRIAATNLRRQGRRVSDKRPRLRPSAEIYQLGLDLMQDANCCARAFDASVIFRDGLMIALLAARPVRLANLASIEINRHLTQHGSDYWLTFPASEMKTHRHLEFPLPRELSLAVEQYLMRYRPTLAAGTGRWKSIPHSGMWISAHGSKLSADRIYQRIVERTRERFGRSINPHLFRDAAATSIAIEDPGHVGIVTAILGHSTTKTGETYYNQASSLEAARSHQAVMQHLRNQSLGKA